MALIRGLRCLCPCPKCYVPWDQLSDLSTEHKLRTAEITACILEQVAALSADEGDQLLKEHGLRNAHVSRVYLFSNLLIFVT